jgi:hypothetical protein
MADTLESTGKYLPKDLRITSQPNAVDKDKFDVVANGLKIDDSYAFQFQYVFSDGTLSDWSPGYTLNTQTESVPGAPSVSIPSTATGGIPVTLSTFPANAKRVDIYVIGGEYGTGKVADYFLAAGTKIIPTVGGVYQVSLITVTPSGINGDPTNTFTTNVSNIVTEDTTAPDPIVSSVATAGPHPQDPSATLGFINLAITNSTIPTDFNGYIVKIIGQSNTWTQEFKSKTALTNLYLTGGLFVGQSYSTSVATSDGKNISAYVNSTPSPITISDTRTNNSTVVGSLNFSATDSILTVSWTASTDPYVEFYKVELTSNADTTFSNILQTVDSRSTTATFGGLTANTTYRVRVRTKYSGGGQLSSNSVSGTVTLDASGAISDGIAPTTNPALTSAMVKSLFGAFAITFPAVTNSDAVTYEVFIKPIDSTGIVSNTYKVLEVGGTFAVIKTLADKTTALSYGTDYYIAIRAKDNDGVSTGTVTAVGPVQTLQVQNADLAADSVYANNIKAGEIDATKLTSDVILASQKITVGSNSALDRVRLDATNATISGQAVSSRIYIGGGNYYDTASPFYADNLGRLSIGQSLKFESNQLTINGSGTFTGTVTAGTGLNSVKLGNDVNGTNDGLYIGATGDYIYTDGTIRLGNGGITYSNGVLNVSGNITANAIAANTSLSGLSITGTTGTFGGVTIDSSGITSTNFSVTSTGILSAAAGTIGGWTINSTQLRSSGTNYISLNPNTPKIALIQGSTEKITIDPVEGIKDSIGNFTLTPSGILTVKGAITSGSTITGADITMTGSVNGYGVGTAKLLFQASNYAVTAGSSSSTYLGGSGYYDSEGDWVYNPNPQTITNNDIRFTDATWGGGIPYNSSFYYGELWLGSGSGSAGSVDLWANHPSGYIGISIVADPSQKNIMVYGDSSAGFGTQHRSSTSDSTKESPAFLQVDSSGRLTRGRAVISGSSSNPSSTLGLTGDLYFSTAV